MKSSIGSHPRQPRLASGEVKKFAKVAKFSFVVDGAFVANDR